ncbi:hypothetical protein V6Z11_D09G231500 [Gossypium hirsutum]|uniref:Protein STRICTOSIDINE SYNTHASE-LIKE 10 n=1 Tax=Gossypium hirsutum TaxID=3635 RepID=A0A1U8I462_GOSHI|nr:protein STRICTOSIDINE SYNTHASE-LIKE 10-like [Gossypium hirsutum]
MMKSFSFFSFFLLFFFVNIAPSYQQVDYDESMFRNYSQINITQGTGPESIAFDCKGEGPYVGVSDGRVLKWEGLKFGWKEFAVPSSFRIRKICDGSTDPNLEPICGRPLGLKFHIETCHLYIADAYHGLLVVGPYGGVAEKLATSAEGVPFKFTNGVDIDTKTGMVYFTDSSTVIQRRNVDSLLRSLDQTGRLLKYNPYTKEVSVIYKGLVFPNGVALSKNNSFLLVAESTRMRILKFNLEGAKAKNMSKVFADPEVFAVLPRVLDNIKRNKDGDFWVALNTGRLESIQSDAPDPIGIKYNEEGTVLKRLDGHNGMIFNSISEVKEYNHRLYIGSVTKPYVGILNDY